MRIHHAIVCVSRWMLIDAHQTVMRRKRARDSEAKHFNQFPGFGGIGARPADDQTVYVRER